MISPRYHSSILIILTLMFVGLSTIVSAQDLRSESAAPIESILNPDGTLRVRPEMTGSFNAEGWRLTTGPHGEPQLFKNDVPAPSAFPTHTEADTGDVHWDNRFIGPYGVDGTVNAIAVNGTDVYFGGSFSGTDAIQAANIVKWNGTTWSPLGTGTDGTVYALLFSGTDLYVGGNFTQAGGAPANSIARWNGSAWTTLGTSPNDGVQGIVFALLYTGTTLYVGGGFTTVGNAVTATYIAKWSGSAWSPVGTGMNDWVCTLTTNGTDLFAGGWFTTAGGNNASHIARWNGSTWFSLGVSPNDGVTGTYVYSAVYVGGSVYAAGSFSKAGGSVNATNIARWNGSTWSALGNGLNNYVYSLLPVGTSLYAAGSFTASGITTINRVAKWDTVGASWSGLGNGTNSTAMVVGQVGSDIYAGGNFTSYTNTSTPAPSNHIAKWSGGTWSALGTSGTINSIDGSIIRTVVVNGTDVYLGGSFITAGSIAANNIVKWNSISNAWTSLGQGSANGVDNTVYAICINGTDVYAGGAFQNAGGLPANHIARWSGSAWTTLGVSPNDGTSNTVNSLLFAGGNLYAGGGFLAAGAGLTVGYVARWNGSAWSALGTGLKAGPGLNSTVYALETMGSDLYAGGFFTTAAGAPANHIAKWNGSAWSTLGTTPNDGVNSIVYALKSIGTSLYVGGAFINAGAAIMVNRIARWNGTAWSALGNGFNSTVYGLNADGASLYATGAFTSSGIATINHIAKWDTTEGGSWKALGSGLNNTGYAVADPEGDVFAGGTFTQAGSKPSFKLAHWNPGIISSVKEKGPLPTAYLLEQNYPNPFNPSTTIRYSVLSQTRVRLAVYNMLGQEVQVLENDTKPAGTYAVIFDASKLSSGTYLYRLVAGNYTETKKLLLIK